MQPTPPVLCPICGSGASVESRRRILVCVARLAQRLKRQYAPHQFSLSHNVLLAEELVDVPVDRPFFPTRGRGDVLPAFDRRPTRPPTGSPYASGRGPTPRDPDRSRPDWSIDSASTGWTCTTQVLEGEEPRVAIDPPVPWPPRAGMAPARSRCNSAFSSIRVARRNPPGANNTSPRRRRSPAGSFAATICPHRST